MKVTRVEASTRSDEDLRDWIVRGQPGWQQAYHALIHVRYGRIVRSAASWAERRHRTSFPWEKVINELFLNLYGSRGTWTGLKSWSREKGAMSGWLWVVTRNVCHSLVQGSNSRRPGEAAHATVSVEEGRPDTLPESSDPAPEDVVTVTMLLERLNPACAEILRFKYYHGMTDTDIGAQRGVGREWTNRQRRRCERALARLLQEEGVQISDFNF